MVFFLNFILGVFTNIFIFRHHLLMMSEPKSSFLKKPSCTLFSHILLERIGVRSTFLSPMNYPEYLRNPDRKQGAESKTN